MGTPKSGRAKRALLDLGYTNTQIEHRKLRSIRGTVLKVGVVIPCRTLLLNGEASYQPVFIRPTIAGVRQCGVLSSSLFAIHGKSIIYHSYVNWILFAKLIGALCWSKLCWLLCMLMT